MIDDGIFCFLGFKKVFLNSMLRRIFWGVFPIEAPVGWFGLGPLQPKRWNFFKSSNRSISYLIDQKLETSS